MVESKEGNGGWGSPGGEKGSVSGVTVPLAALGWVRRRMYLPYRRDTAHHGGSSVAMGEPIDSPHTPPEPTRCPVAEDSGSLPRGLWESRGVPDKRGVPALGERDCTSEGLDTESHESPATRRGGYPRGGLPPPVSQQWRPGRRPLIVPPRNLSLTRGLPCLVFDCLSNTARRGASARHVATCGQSSLLTASSPIDPLPQPGPRRYFPRWFPRSFSSPPVFPHLFPFRTPPVPHRLYPFRTPSRYFHLDLLLPSVYPHSYALSEWKKGPEKPSSPSVSLYSIRDERKLYFLPQSTRTFLPPP